MANRFIDWFFSPAVDILETFQPKDIQTKVIDLSVIESKFEKDIKSKIFRPQNFEQYIGQTRAKETIRDYIKGTQERDKTFPHTLIYGKAGCGKTTLAEIIAKELKRPFKEITASQLKNPLELMFKIAEVQGGVLFTDEIHELDRPTVESIYSIMEYFTYQGNPIKPFTLIGATTELGEIKKDRRPFFERFPLPIPLVGYDEKEISEIAKQYLTNTFPSDTLSDSIITTIGNNSRRTPRTALQLVDATIYAGNNVQRALDNRDIIKDGYTRADLKVLKYVKKNENGVGLQGIVSYLETSGENYLYDIEPFLLTNDLILRTPRGRKITEEGKKKIEELEKI